MAAHPERPLIALVPLDERPVNTGLVRDVARIAGVDLELPPAAALPNFRHAGDTETISRWLIDVAGRPSTSAIVISADTLVHGGLIPARTSHDSTVAVVDRLEVLRAVKSARPDLPVYVVSLITRASDSYSNVEEPEYWSEHGRELHALGGAVHSQWVGAIARDIRIPDSVRADFAGRRLRNHIVNLAALGLRWEGVIDYLSLTADDTARWSAGSAEQEWLRYWQLLRPRSGMAMHPGADETGAVLVSRAVLAGAGIVPTVTVIPGDPGGMVLIPSYENQPLAETIPRHIASAGATVGDTGEIALVIHTPDPQGADQFAIDEPARDESAARLTAGAVRDALERYETVVLADLRYGNGADPALIELLASEGLLWRLSAYSGWNTAGNAAGSAIALGLATVAGRAAGTLDARAVRSALARRVLDDYAYQAVVRRRVSKPLFGDSIAPVPADAARRAEPIIRDELAAVLARLGAPDDVVLESVALPWLRSFEVDIVLRADEEIA